MASWSEVEGQAPEFAAAVRARFDAHKHKVLATLRRDGSPRVSGIEATFADGELWIGSMPNARKAADLARDPRVALHSASVDPPEDPTTWEGDAKLSGRAVVVDDPERLASMGGNGGEDSGTLYRIDIDEVVLTRVAASGEYLDVEVWTPGRGLRLLRAG
jgi:hypothetical protein